MTISVLDKLTGIKADLVRGHKKLARRGFTPFGPSSEEMERRKPSD